MRRATVITTLIAEVAVIRVDIVNPFTADPVKALHFAILV